MLTYEVTERTIGEPESTDGGLRYQMVTTVLVSRDDGQPIDPAKITAAIAGDHVCEVADDGVDLGGKVNFTLAAEEANAGAAVQAGGSGEATQANADGGENPGTTVPADLADAANAAPTDGSNEVVLAGGGTPPDVAGVEVAPESQTG